MSKLLTIELDNVNSIPKVVYKGEEISKKMHIHFDWKTKTYNPVIDNPVIKIEHVETDEGKPNVKLIGYNTSYND